MLAIVFPGQGAQTIGMGLDFAREHPASREVFEIADEAFGGGLRERIESGPDAELARTEITQPAILTAAIAVYRAVAEQLPAAPAFFAGHSLGEYAALVAAGGLPLGDAVRLVRRRGAFMQEAVPPGEGDMAAIIGLDGARVASACAGVDGPVAPANFNSPVQTVIAGRRSSVAEAVEACKEAGAKRVVSLPVSAPFHCELMQPAADKLGPELDAAAFTDFDTPVISNVTAEAYSSADSARRLLLQQVCAPVRWVECVQRLIAAGVTVQLELGPGKVLSGLAAKIDRGLARANIETLEDVDAALEKVGEVVA
jgi:[acyl-carrier-protein] S-malonyltransferase